MEDEAPPAGDRAMNRLYVGNLPTDAEKRDIEELFAKYGTILDISVKRTVSGVPFAFIEYESDRDAQDAIKGRDGYELNGFRLRVEVPFASRAGGAPRGRGGAGMRGGSRGGAGMQQPRRGEHRVIVSGLPPSGSWQDLKDHMRDAGVCIFADVFNDGSGVVEFSRREDADYAVKYFNDSRFRSHEGEVSRLSIRYPDDNGRRSPSPYRGDRDRGDRDRGDRGDRGGSPYGRGGSPYHSRGGGDRGPPPPHRRYSGGPSYDRGGPRGGYDDRRPPPHHESYGRGGPGRGRSMSPPPMRRRSPSRSRSRSRSRR